MDLTGLDLGAWLTKSGAVVLVHEYDDVTQVFIGHVVHPMREVRYGKDGRLVSCSFLGGESQTVEHEQQLHEWLHLDRRLDTDNDAVYVTNMTEWLERNSVVRRAVAPPRQYNFETEEWEPVPAALGDTLDHLYRLITHGVSSVAEKDAVKACVERFNNLVKTVRGE